MTRDPADRTRLWIWSGRALEVWFLLGVVAVAVLEPDRWWVLLFFVVPSATGVSWLLVPTRPWWGPGPMALMSDPVTRKAWRRSEILFLIAAFVVIGIVGPAVLAATGVAP